MDHAALSDLVREIDEEGEGLTEWEIEFISRLIDEGVSRFSERQAEVIQRIHSERVES